MAVKKLDPVTKTPKQDATKMSPKDRTATVTHLAETVEYNAKHSLNHAVATAKIATRLSKRYSGDPDFVTLIHNAQHTAKHAMDTQEHSDRLIGHLKKAYPGSRAAYNELMNPKPTDVPTPPGSTKPIKGTKKTSK